MVKIYFSISVLLISFLNITYVSGQQKINIVPHPQQIEFYEGVFSLSEEIEIELFLDNKELEEQIFSQLKQEFDQSLNIKIRSDVNNIDHKIVIGIPGLSQAFDRLIRHYDLGPGEKEGKEGYRLMVEPELILISANTKVGAFYGTQTLKQLIRTKRIDVEIPSLKIRDWPDLEIRGIMDDISRGPVPTKEYMRQQIERMSEMKINMLTYYTQDVVKTESHPAFAPPGGAITLQEWAELADYAKKHHIDLVGNFQSFGHFGSILQHPEYEHLGESGTLLSPAFEESYQLLEDIYTEMIPAFHSDYFHINADETFDLGTGASKPLVDSLGIAVVYSNHIKRIHEIITGLGKKVIMWGDIALENPKILELLPKDIIMTTWDYSVRDDYSSRFTPFKDAGFKLLASSAILNSFSIMPDFNVSKGNIRGLLAEAKQQNAWGMLNTIWDDGGFALFSRDWYGVAYAADQSWNSNPVDITYNNRFNRAIYGGTNNGFTDAVQMLNELANLKTTEKMNEDVLWERIIPEKGEQTLINVQEWPQVEEIAQQSKKKLESFDPLIYKEDVRYIHHVIDIYQFLAFSRPAILKASELYNDAYLIQENDFIAARKKLVKAHELISKAYDKLISLKVENEFLWMLENRVYAMDRVIERYAEQINTFGEVKELIIQVIHEFDKKEPLPAAAQVRLGIEESEGWYFRGWLMIEPMPNPDGFKDPGVDHLADMGGIENTFPNVTEEFYFNGIKYRWRRVNTPYFSKVDLSELFDPDENVILYAFAHIDVSEDRTVRALAGSSDGIEVFVNGKSVHKNYVERRFKMDEDEFYLPLTKGRNHLMIRITNGTGEWAFSFRLPDSEMRSYKNRYNIIE